MTQTINQKIQRAFNRSAGQYEQFSALHRQIAERLLAQVAASSTILDVGCGTGYLTGRLKEKFPESRIIGLDFAEGMLQVARAHHQGMTWILADSQNLPFPDENFEAVVSNLVYQWARDLTQAFSEARRVLGSNGVFACTLFGFNTCRELFQSFEETNASLQFTRLFDGQQVRQALHVSGFKNTQVSSEENKMIFKDMRELMNWLKSIGANNLVREGYVGKESVAKASAIYNERFACGNGVAATFEVIYVYAKK